MNVTSFAKAIDNISTSVSSNYTAGSNKLYVASTDGIVLFGVQWIRVSIFRLGISITILKSVGIGVDALGPYLAIAGAVDNYNNVNLLIGDIAELRVTAGEFTDIHTAINTLEMVAAQDSAVVHLTGNETISGTKTFSSTIAGNISGIALNTTNVISRSFHGGRLTVTSGNPVEDNASGTTLYYTPYIHDVIGLYDTSTSSWYAMGFGELSMPIPNYGNPVDVFMVNNSGTLSLEGVGWANATLRAVALAYADRILVKSTDPAHLYLGTYQVSSATTTQDTPSQRLVWNNYNRIQKKAYVTDTTVSWLYGVSNTWRVANGNANNCVSVVVGIKEQYAQLSSLSISSANIDNTYGRSGIGYDSTTVNTMDISTSTPLLAVNVTGVSQNTIYHRTDIGFHRYYWLESAYLATSQITFYGRNDPSAFGPGLGGFVWC